MPTRTARLIPALVVTIMGAGVATGQIPGYVDPMPVLDAAAKAIGTANLRCVTISGTAYAGAVGQQRESARNVDSPRVYALANYTRTMDRERGSTKMVSLWPPTELAEGYFYEAIRENFIISDGTRNFFNAVRKLGLEPLPIVPVHGRPVPWADLR